MLSATNYAQNYAGIIGKALVVCGWWCGMWVGVVWYVGMIISARPVRIMLFFLAYYAVLQFFSNLPIMLSDFPIMLCGFTYILCSNLEQ